MADPAAWIRAHKAAAAVGGVGAVGAAALIMRKRSSSSSASSGAGLGTSAGASPGLTGSAGLDTTAWDTYNQLSSAISSQNDQIGQIQTELAHSAVASVPPSTGSGVLPSFAGEALVGSGYNAGTGTSVTTGSGTFNYLATMPQVNAILAGGGQVDYQPTPGTFVPTSSLSGLAPGTPLFQPAGA